MNRAGQGDISWRFYAGVFAFVSLLKAVHYHDVVFGVICALWLLLAVADALVDRYTVKRRNR